MHQTYFVYKITCRENGKCYIGVSKNPEQRFYKHRYAARRNSPFPIHNAMRKHGIAQFDFDVIYGSKDEHYIREEMETYFINLYNSRKNGYNCTDGGEGIHGYDEAWIEKMRVVGASISKETRQLRSESAKAQHTDPVQKAAHKAAASKANQDPEKRQRIAEAARKRWADPVFIAKMQAKYATPEQREKKRKARAIRGTILHTAATKEKIRQAKLGRTLSEEHKDKIRQSMKKYKAANTTA